MTLGAKWRRRAIELGGRFDGHELPENINKVTAASASRAGGAGPDGRRPRHLSARRHQLLVRRGVCRSRSGCRDGQVPRRSTTPRSATRAPSSIRARLADRCSAARCWAWGTRWRRRRSTTSITDWRWPRGSTRTVRRRSWTSRANMKWEAVNIPDPETPVGARGIGEPPVAAGACAVLNALSDALGDDVYRRAPVDARQDPDGARARPADARAADGAHLREARTPWRSFTT